MRGVIGTGSKWTAKESPEFGKGGEASSAAGAALRDEDPASVGGDGLIVGGKFVVRLDTPSVILRSLRAA